MLLVGRGGGLRGTKIVNKIFVNKRAFPILGDSHTGRGSRTLFQTHSPKVC